MIKYAYSSFANTYFPFYHGKTTKMFSLTCKVLALSTLERGKRSSLYQKSLVQEENFISDRLCVRNDKDFV
jgi:hypothetical protein